MITYIKTFSFKNLTSKIGVLYFLNITDLILTLILIQTDYIVEANPLMVNVLSNTSTTFFVKILLPALLFIYLLIRLKSATPEQLKLSNYFISGLTFFYLSINCLHLLWFGLLFFIL